MYEESTFLMYNKNESTCLLVIIKKFMHMNSYWQSTMLTSCEREFKRGNGEFDYIDILANLIMANNKAKSYFIEG